MQRPEGADVITKMDQAVAITTVLITRTEVAAARKGVAGGTVDRRGSSDEPSRSFWRTGPILRSSVALAAHFRATRHGTPQAAAYDAVQLAAALWCRPCSVHWAKRQRSRASTGTAGRGRAEHGPGHVAAVIDAVRGPFRTTRDETAVVARRLHGRSQRSRSGDDREPPDSAVPSSVVARPIARRRASEGSPDK